LKKAYTEKKAEFCFVFAKSDIHLTLDQIRDNQIKYLCINVLNMTEGSNIAVKIELAMYNIDDNYEEVGF